MARIISYFLCLSILLTFTLQYSHAAELRGFEKFLQRNDIDGDGEVSKAEFQGNPRMFGRFDLNDDGKITAAEFKQARQNRVRSKDQESRHRPETPLPEGVRVERDLEYATVDGNSLALDLYLPDKMKNPPLIVWVHGGGWTRGDKTEVNSAVIGLTQDGFAVASLNYRLGGVTLHPKQVQDLKGAIRWLRANAKKYAYDAGRIAIGGGSAGGHLALLLGLSGGVEDLEGNVGGNLAASSRVQAIIDMYGPSDLEEYAKAKPKFQRRKSTELLQAASPLRYLSKDDPPLLILHGDQDEVVPLEQSQLLYQRYQQAGLESELHILKGAGHGGRSFKDQTTYQLVKDFLQKHLLNPTEHESGKTSSRVAPETDAKKSKRSIQPTMPNEIEHTKLHGFHWMIGPKAGLEGSEQRFNELLDRIDRNLSSNPYITGVYIIYHWRLLEPQQGNLDFSRLDRVIERVRKHGRYYKLALNPGIYSPDWLYAKGAEAFETVGSNPARKQLFQKNIRIPVPWDPVFQSSYFDTLAKVADHYRDDRYFRAITLTVATFMSPEWHLPKSADDLRRWQGLPDYQAKLERAWIEGIDRFAALFPTQYLVLEASSYPLGLKALGDAVVEHGATRQAGRFAVQIDQLNGRLDQVNQATYRKLLEYKKRYGSDILIGLQNVKGWGGEKLREQQGSPQMTTYNFLQAGGDYWELWYHDGSSKEICEDLDNLLQAATKLGLEGFKQNLIKEGEYRSAGKS